MITAQADNFRNYGQAILGNGNTEGDGLQNRRKETVLVKALICCGAAAAAAAFTGR